MRLHGALASTAPSFSNPIDALEEMANREGWSYYFSPSDASDGRSLTIELPGRYSGLEFTYEWSEEEGALAFSCCIEPGIPWARKEEVRKLLDRVEKVRAAMKLSGWFDLSDDNFIWFWERLSRSAEYRTWEMVIATSMAEALEHCNALMPLFLKTAWGESDFDEEVIRLTLEEVKGMA